MKIKFVTSIILMIALVFCITTVYAKTPAITMEDGGYSVAKDAVEATAKAFESADTIYQDLKEIILTTIEDAEKEDDTEYDSEETEASLGEINAYSDQIRALLNSISILPDDPTSSEGKTVLATREYLTMLLNITTDLSVLIRYGVDLNEAISVMEEMNDETETYQDYADVIWFTTNEAIEMLEIIKPPVYLTISHEAFIKRIDDFRVFAEDFYYAAVLEDPLRIYSCIFRLERIARMFEICGEDLQADLMLQIRQAERRLNGPIAVLHTELTNNLAILLSA